MSKHQSIAATERLFYDPTKEVMNIELIEQETTEIVEYSKTEASLADLRSRMANVEYDVITVKGMAIAKADRAEVRGLRTGLESLRKQIKAPALAHCKLIDDEARRITAELLKLETPIDEQIKAREAALEAEKVAREAVERARISEIHARISEIRGYHALALQCRTADAVQKLIDRLTDVELTGFEEFDDEAKATRASTMLEMERILGQKQVDEAEQVRIKAEQAEAAEKLAHERKLMEEERAAIQASLDAQRAEQDAIAKRNRDAAITEADRLATERQKLADEMAAKRAAEQAEFNRQREELAAQRAEIEKQKAAIAHTAIEPAATEIDLVVDAEVKPDDVLVLTDEMVSIPFVTERPTAEELIQVIAAQYQVSDHTAAEWLDAADFSPYY